MGQINQIVRKYEDERRKKTWKQKNIIERADHHMREAIILNDYICHHYSNIFFYPQFSPHYLKGCREFKIAKQYINQMTNKEQKTFWNLHKKNQHVQKFENLIK